MTPEQIGIAVVEHNGKFLVGTRGPEGPLAGYAEFPGGKCHPGESPAECACRECLEETGLEVEPIELLLNTQHKYDHGAVDLHFWRCNPRNPQQLAADHHGYRWVPASEIVTLKFPPANERVITMLIADIK